MTHSCEHCGRTASHNFAGWWLCVRCYARTKMR
jgi:hypothetical protein